MAFKILIVSQYFWPENFRINDLAVGLVERGHAVTVLTGIPNYPQGRYFTGYSAYDMRREEYHGVHILRVPLVPRGNGSGVRLAINYFSFALAAVLLAPFRCRGKYDLILVCQLSPVTVALPALLLKKIKKAPILLWVLDLWPESLVATGAVRSERVLKHVEKLVTFIYRGCDKIVVASRGFLPSITAKGVASKQTGYFPNWNEPEYGKPLEHGAVMPTLDLPLGFRVMFAGNIGVAQDFETILTAAENLKPYSNIHWLILGDGRQYDWVKEQVAARGLTTRFLLLGRHAPETMVRFFAQADTMLVTLKRDPAFALTIPGKIQSYLACGRPIVAALDGEGARLIKESGAGLSVPAEDPDALAAAVLTMYRMTKAERDAMGIRGSDYCEKNFKRELLFDRMEGWMMELVRSISKKPMGSETGP